MYSSCCEINNYICLNMRKSWYKQQICEKQSYTWAQKDLLNEGKEEWWVGREKKEGWKEGGWICYNDVQTHRNIHFERYSTAAKMLEKRTGRLFTWKLGRMPCLVVLIFGLNHTAEEEMFLSSLGMGKQKYLFECLYVCVEDRRASPGFCGRLCIFALSLKAGFWFNWEAWAGESHLTGRKIGAKPRWLWMDTLVCVCVC